VALLWPFASERESGKIEPMTEELWVLFASVCLGIVHVSVDSFSFKAQVGNAYTVGARDEPVEREKVAGRLHRAARNYTENLILFAIVVVLLHLAEQSQPLSHWGAYAWIGGRIAYLFAYWSGVPWVRTVCWQVSMIGLVCMMIALFL
jgi:uncharacterized MAPEG superfamily protein